MIILCCGMPRSGSTLQFNIVWHVAEASGLGRKVDWRSSAAWETAGDELQQMADDDRLHVLKMHSLPSTLRDLAVSSDRVRFVYVHRDIRDVAVSMRVKFHFSISKAVRRIESSLALEDWLRGRPEGSVLVQDYDTLLNGLPVAIDQISDFLDADLDRDAAVKIASELNIEDAYRKSRKKRVPFETIRRRIAMLLGRKVAFADERLMLHPAHVSNHKGQIGVWQTALDAADLKTLEAHFGDRIQAGFQI